MADGRPSTPSLDVQHSLFAVRCCFFCSAFVSPAFGATNDATNAGDSISPPPAQNETARGFYNAGTEKLRAEKLDDAETLLESSVAKQDARVQPAALFNLGHVRFAQGNEELKKSPGGATKQSVAATADGMDAIQKAVDALASNDIQQMVDAYIAGRGVRKEMSAATKAVQHAMEQYGRTLSKWRRSLSDFQSAAELNPADTNAVHNTEVVEQAIAKLVDSLREMQSAAGNLAGKQGELNELLKQLKGKIPAANMPPGAAGGDVGDEGDDGDHPMPESLSGFEEARTGDTGQETGMKISPEEAGALMNSIQPDGKQLPMGQGDLGQPKTRSGRNW